MYSANILPKPRGEGSIHVIILRCTPSRGGIIDLYHNVDALEARSLPRATSIAHSTSNIKGQYTPMPYHAIYPGGFLSSTASLWYKIE